jgi:hypothetical protein
MYAADGLGFPGEGFGIVLLQYCDYVVNKSQVKRSVFVAPMFSILILQYCD